jgi:hypothetical protein
MRDAICQGKGENKCGEAKGMLKYVGPSCHGLFVFPTLSVAFWGWVEKVGWGVFKPNRAAGHTARIRLGQGAGISASHGRGVNGFVGVGMGGDIVGDAMGGGKVVLAIVGLARRKLAQ